MLYLRGKYLVYPYEKDKEGAFVKLLVINNLSSGLRDGSIYDFLRSFTEDGDEIVLRSTNGTTRLEDLLSDALSFDAVVASGGDGTVASVCSVLANTGIPILPFPAGTANLLAENILSPMEPHGLAKLLREGRTLDFDLGVIESGGERHGFNLMAGAGYDAVIMRDAQPNKHLLGPMAYFSAALTNALPQKAKLTVTLDDQEPFEVHGLGVLLINFSKIQFDITITHENEPRDGLFEVVILKAQTAFDLIPSLFAGILDRSGGNPDRGEAMELHRARRVRVESDPPLEIQYDGEPTKLTTPFTAYVIPKAARLVVSEEGYAAFEHER